MLNSLLYAYIKLVTLNPTLYTTVKTAIFSDIHANLAALNAVLDDAREHGVNNFACLGDIVGYGPNPSECIAKIQDIKCVCVRGNHDEDSSNVRSLDNLNELARKSLEWTRSSLSSGQKQWLSSLPLQRRLGRNILVHASLNEPGQWEYVTNKFDAGLALKSQSAPICFFGHTHRPVCYEYSDRSATAVKASEIKIETDKKYLINVGSVGQPRDGNAKASYVIYNRIERTISFRRVEYDVRSVMRGIETAGLPSKLATRLIEAA